MLKSLVLTTLLTTGVAVATPVCDAPNLQKKADNIVTDYSLTLSLQNSSVSTYGNVDTGYLSYKGQDNERIRNYSGTNLALNVLASQYKTKVTYNENGYINTFFVNTEWYDEYVYWYDDASLIVNIFQIDTYNYNIDTNINTTVSIDIDTNIFNLSTYTVDQAYWLRSVYTTVEDWSTYLHRQLTSFNGRKILNDIEDVNNNFYYTQSTSWLPGETRNDTFDIELQPNNRNYMLVVYMPMVRARENGNIVGSNYTTIPFIDEDDMSIENFVFSGTNVIPGGTYEVVDIPGLMWQILEMPFAFVSQAFNLTLFPGTPYQVNISNLFLSIIAIFVFVWLIGLLFKLKG